MPTPLSRPTSSTRSRRPLNSMMMMIADLYGCDLSNRGLGCRWGCCSGGGGGAFIFILFLCFSFFRGKKKRKWF